MKRTSFDIKDAYLKSELDSAALYLAPASLKECNACNSPDGKLFASLLKWGSINFWCSLYANFSYGYQLLQLSSN